ncbi:hypothetical protein MKY95_21115 [Paenibacillus sp. FSL P4-0176]|uniref:hypothetical protein n=1 Tax=Paenibacillus sp. FSL P4-0176 TaxID=2921631 RepID=UPI0030CE1200
MKTIDPDNVPKINVGDRVTHKKHSSGIVTTISIFGKAYVKWDNPILTGSVRVTDLKLLEDTK